MDSEQVAQRPAGELDHALTERELAPVLGLSVATLRAWRRSGKGPRYVRFGRAVRYMENDVEQFVRASRT